jgi:hypothetical protein
LWDHSVRRILAVLEDVVEWRIIATAGVGFPTGFSARRIGAKWRGTQSAISGYRL